MDEQEVEIETSEESGLQTEMGTPVILYQGSVVQQVLWPAPSSELPDVIFEHEFLAAEPVPTSGWVAAATYDWDSEGRRFTKRVKDDGEG